MVVEARLSDLFERQIGRETRAFECASSVRSLAPRAAVRRRDILELLVLIDNLHAMLIPLWGWLLVGTSKMTVDRHDRGSGRVSVIRLGTSRRRQGRRSHDYRNRRQMTIYTKQWQDTGKRGWRGCA